MSGNDRPRALRWRIEDAVKRSRLDPPARHVLLTLLTYVDVNTGLIPYERSPSLTALTQDTGYARSTIAKHLEFLVTWGWLHRTPPPVAEQLRRARTRYRVLLPPGPPDELVRDTDQIEPCGQLDGGDWSDSRTSSPDEPVLVRQTLTTGPPVGLTTDPDPSDRPSTPVGHVDNTLLQPADEPPRPRREFVRPSSPSVTPEVHRAS